MPWVASGSQEWPLVDSQQESEDFSIKTTLDGALPTTQMGKEMDLPLESPPKKKHDPANASKLTQ